MLSLDAAPAVFGGGSRTIPVIWHNTSGHIVSSPISLELWQVQSSIAALVGKVSWKELRLLPGQTVLESAAIEVPAVRAQTRFLARWLGTRNEILGISELLAYPTNLLRDLQALAGLEPVGLYDPDDELKPLLKAMGVAYADLMEQGFDGFAGELLIIGPFDSANSLPGWLPNRIRSNARKGAAVVWLLPAQDETASLTPSFFTVLVGKGVVIVAQPSLVKNLAQSPTSQMRLLELCRAAIMRRVPGLPSMPVKR